MKDQIVYYYEDRVSGMVNLSDYTVEEEDGWWDQVAPYIAHMPRPELDRMPDLRVVDVAGLAADRELLSSSVQLGYGTFLRAGRCREMIALNAELSEALRSYLASS